jgi:RES domain-containing protein
VGSLRNGGRYNSPGEFAALYNSLDAATAVMEVARGLRLRGVDPSQYSEGDWWIYEFPVEIDDVLDLTSPKVLDKLGLQKESLTGADLNTPREIAREARLAGYRALIAPSAAVPGAKNLVIFPDNLPHPLKARRSKPIKFPR